MKPIWFTVPFVSIIALSALAFQEAKLTETAWWSCVLPALVVLALWKYQVRRWIGKNWNPSMSMEAYISARPLAYWWLGMYFFLITGFFVAIFTSEIYDFRIPRAAALSFLSLWWSKTELLGLWMCRTPEGYQVHSNV